MLCEICGENEATFHYSEVVNGNKTEHHLCSECAAKTDISYYTNLLDGDGRLGQLLSGLLGMPVGGGQDDPKTHVVCPGCHLSSVLREEGFIKLDRRRGAVIAVDVDKIRAMQELTDDMRVIVAKALCKNLTQEEIHALVDEIISEYIGED